ncbi:MAG: type II/IV secretion system protein, partial [Candidatus Liptonbacteria bacterium]|nr:type II/IV secretion system protein [Candidatus Liptonbacteria bacterium]
LGTIRAVAEEIGALAFDSVVTTELFEILLAGALATRASDIHLEAQEKEARVRFRVDGVLHDVYSALPLKNYESLTTRVKLLSGLKINVRTEPQDGRFTVALTKKEVEMRVSVIPSEFGETVVMRILDPDAIAISLSELGLRPDDLAIVEDILKRPNGLVLNTGPTGSGKTTTLYAFLRSVANPEVKVITIEDPIEYHLAGVEQTQTDRDANYTFASGLRSILRQDPDVILVGEIRDKETAEIAMQAALTGHLVFSTLHTNDAVGAIPRLADLEVKTTTIGPALTLVIAQRLVRRLCAKCKKKAAIPPELAKRIEAFLKKLPARVLRAPYRTATLFEAAGCAACSGVGYKGRVGIFEFFRVDAKVQEAIVGSVSRGTLDALAGEQGMVSMQEDGVLKALSGVTTLEEVERATGPVQWQ